MSDNSTGPGDHCRTCGVVCIGVACATCAASGAVLADVQETPQREGAAR